jgi:hypothetical protein
LLGGGNVGGGGGGGGTTPTPPELLPPHAETVSAAAVTDATNQLERNKERIPIRGKKTSEKLHSDARTNAKQRRCVDAECTSPVRSPRRVALQLAAIVCRAPLTTA